MSVSIVSTMIDIDKSMFINLDYFSHIKWIFVTIFEGDLG
jgi:hypothetical protein